MSPDFANGAVTGAIMAAMAGSSRSGEHNAPDGAGREEVYPSAEARTEFDALAAKLYGTRHASERAAADTFGDTFLPFTRKYGLEAPTLNISPNTA